MITRNDVVNLKVKDITPIFKRDNPLKMKRSTIGLIEKQIERNGESHIFLPPKENDIMILPDFDEWYKQQKKIHELLDAMFDPSDKYLYQFPSENDMLKRYQAMIAPEIKTADVSYEQFLAMKGEIMSGRIELID
jgi:hypothetical protein